MTPDLFLGFQCNNLDQAIEFGKEFKISLKEREVMNLIAKWKHIDLTPDHIVDIMYEYEGKDKKNRFQNYRLALAKIILYQEKFGLYFLFGKNGLHARAAPTFPVQAQDILDLDIGYEEGSKLGAEIRRLTGIWIASGYLLDKSKLLKEVRHIS